MPASCGAIGCFGVVFRATFMRQALLAVLSRDSDYI
jgi:hypothetical protein